MVTGRPLMTQLVHKLNQIKTWWGNHIWTLSHLWCSVRRIHWSGSFTAQSAERVSNQSLIARFRGQHGAHLGADWNQVGPMLVPWNLLSGVEYGSLFKQSLILTDWTHRGDFWNNGLFSVMYFLFVLQCITCSFLAWEKSKYETEIFQYHSYKHHSLRNQDMESCRYGYHCYPVSNYVFNGHLSSYVSFIPYGPHNMYSTLRLQRCVIEMLLFGTMKKIWHLFMGRFC